MKKINDTINKKSVSEYCSDYINGFNAHQLSLSWKRNAIKVVAIASVSSAVFSANDAQAQAIDCPPAFEQIESRGALTNPQGLTNTPYRTAPVFVDFDGDGDIDIISGSGGIPASDDFRLFENTGTTTAPNWAAPVLAPNGLSGADLIANFAGSNFTPSFVDIDNDGDLDVFIGTFNSGILYQENTGSATAPNYAAAIANPFGITTAGIGNFTAPSFVDIDGDGDQDMFIGDLLDTNIFFFENTGSATAPTFVAGTPANQFGFDNIGYVTRLNFADLDNDGDSDVMMGDYYGNFTYYENTGSATAPSFASNQVNPFFIGGGNTTWSSVSFADVDNDGDFDLISGEEFGDYIYHENYGTPTEPKYSNFPFDIATLADGYNALDYADMDGDGDIDIILGNDGGDVLFIENIATSTPGASFAAPVSILTVGGFEVHPTVADLDGDGDIDILVGGFAGTNLTYFENIGNATTFNFAAPVVSPFGLTGAGGSLRAPEFMDIDGDGDQDILVGRGVAGALYFENTGTSTAPAYAAAVTNPFGLSGIAAGASFGEVDIDNDGDLDLAYGDDAAISFYLNTGTSTAPNFVDAGNSFGIDDNADTDYDVTVVDIDQDGNYEAFVGNKSSDLFIYKDTKVIPEISIVEGASIFSCNVNTLSISSTNIGLNDLTVTWYDSNNNAVATGPTFTLTSLDTETYSVKAVSAAGCESNQPTVNVIKNTPVISIVEGSSISSCDINTLSISSTNFALSDLTVTWYDSNNNAVATGPTFTLTSLDTETYSVKAVSTTGCESNQPTVDVVKNVPIISVVEGTTVNSCEVTTLSVASSNFSLSDLTFEWLNANNTVVGTGQTFTIPSLETQTYRVRATSVTGCQSTVVVNVVKETPIISVTEGTSVFSCEPVTLNVESSNTLLSDLTFTWYDKDNNAVATGLSYEVDPLALPQTGPKTFSVRAVGTTGCESNLVTVSVSCSDEVSINLTASAGYNSANLNWTATGARPIREYEVYGDPGQGGTYFLFGFSPTTSYGAIGLMNGQNVNFKVRAVYTDGKYSPYSNVVTVRPSVVLGEDDKNKAGFAFFPNPNSGEFNIKLQDGSASATISVTSISGQRVYTTTLNASQSSINLGNVASGMYIILVETAQGTYQQKISVVR
ncbi:FG-GAP-like repeat-containing protein [Bernardetia sp. MNP-M8]|uniref:FG-GAP-like repeat-containing protein n=1 Tax=Bernardetia sp. MNP-M8 TaxID=3127470 RepID=UPI0030CF6E38